MHAQTDRRTRTRGPHSFLVDIFPYVWAEELTHEPSKCQLLYTLTNTHIQREREAVKGVRALYVRP